MSSLLSNNNGNAKMMTTALMDEDSSYECFVAKGSCRKCGCKTYGKRKCQRCERKFCGACASRSLQKYGTKAWEECCVGCEPSLVVITVDAEPLEWEPEPEEVATLKKELMVLPDRRIMGAPLLHVPLSAATTSTTDDTDSTDDSEEGRQGDSPSLPQAQLGESEATTYSLNLNEEESPRTVPEMSRSCAFRSQQEEAPQTPPRNIKNTTGLTMRSPDSGYCTTCRKYATGKVPCRRCGAKYCHGTDIRTGKDSSSSSCLDNLYASDGTCAKCYHSRNQSVLVAHKRQPGCCTVCHHYETGKLPCDTCGAKFCQLPACLKHLFGGNEHGQEGSSSCVACRGQT